MTTRTLHLGIDLGTTNSTAAVFDGERMEVVRNSQGGVLTPSVVRIDARGNVVTGARARRSLESDPENTRGEFKRLLGTSHTLAFQAAGVTKTPVELSAEILRSLRADVEHQFGFAPAAAVITVPALFELHQTRATSEAARLAGFSRVEMLQEPVASAIAAGFHGDETPRPWLVYDLGGGTFDVSLLETNEGLLRVVAHDGDNFLGGRDFDAAILDLVLERAREIGGPSLDRADPAHAVLLRKLRVAVEDAKIELTRSATSYVLVPAGPASDAVEVELHRHDVEHVVKPLIDRSIAICHRLLAARGIVEEGLSRIVLVGGPTGMPFLRRCLDEAFGVSSNTGLDPMTLVAQGAALFAGTVGLDARVSANAASTSRAGRPSVWLQYPAMTSDRAPFVVGRVLEAANGVDAVRLTRTDGGFTSGPEAIDAEGSFAIAVELEPRKPNEFVVEGRTQSGFVKLEPEKIRIVHGLTLGDPPLSRSIGIALANGYVHVYFERGTPLPVRKTFTHKTATTLEAGDSDCALSVPIVQGETRLARLARLVGRLEIHGGMLSSSVPVGSEISVTLELDRGGTLSATARIPTISKAFDQVVQLVAPDVTPEAMESLALTLRDRAMAARGDAFRSGAAAGLKKLASVESLLAMLDDALVPARSGDPDALEKARRITIELDETISDVEDAHAAPEALDDLHDLAVNTHGWVETHGTPAEKKLLADTMMALERAQKAMRIGELSRVRSTLSKLLNTAYFRWPEAWERELFQLEGYIEQATDVRAATRALEEGRRAAAANDRSGVEGAVRALWKLLPRTTESRAVSHDSGLR